MRKLGAILLSFLLLIGLFPQFTSAAGNTTFEQDLIQYLNEVSEVRGFEVTREDIEASLSAYEDSLENYESVEELGGFLGEVIQSDLSNLDSIYEEFELDEAGLHQLLEENGEEENDYIFVDNLYSTVYFYTEDGVFERDPNFEQDFVEYLATVSEERGFEVTKEDVEVSLAQYETKLEEFESVEDLSDFLGEVIKAGFGNLDYFYDNYQLDQPALFQLLEENGDDINQYVYIDDLEQVVWEYAGDELFPGMDEEIAADLLPIFQEEIDLTDDELKRIEDHLMSLEEHLSDPAILERLEDLGNRMMAFEEFDVAAELTAEQIAEMASIYDEFLTIFKLKAEYALVQGGSETTLSFWDLLNLEELKDANLKVAFFSTDGQLLADLIVTGEMVDSGTVTETGEQINESAEEVTKTVEQSAAVKPQKSISNVKSEVKTVKGAKLPKTASDYLPNALLGLAVVLIGILIFRKVKKA